ncbi:hypothetical protein ACOMHN_000830 [Nucella lapillus]
MSQGTRVNGPGSPTGRYIDTVDPDDPEYIRNLQRPAEVKEDMKQMEGRSRVSVVLNSQAFKEELEAVIHEQIRQGGPASLFALQQISDLLLPQSRGFNSSFARSSPVIAINDIRGVETLGYSKQEKVLRCKLAACYRLVDMFGWTHGIYNHISARVSQDQEQFLVNPFGMLYSEVTASTLVKVDIRGEVVDSGSTGLGISKAGFCLHSAIHQARPDIRCVIHLHTPAAVAVSATKQGFLPISQEALICGKVSYHEYRGILVDQEERDLLARNLGPFNKVMFLRNHGVAACGESIEEAFHYAFNLMAACESQVKVMSVGMENLVLVDDETRERTFKVGNEGGGGVDTSGRKWRCGELEFEALMRTLDNSGYRTGHMYKQPLMKQEKKEKMNSDVELPPASSSFTYVFDGDYEHSKYVSPIKLAMERQKQAYKAGWLTSPNAYKKQEIEEIGTTTPKKITKWVQDGETPDQRSTAVRADSLNQFAPQGSNPKEFKDKQKSIRKDYYEEKVTAGPQSKILDGISEWDEVGRTQDGEKTVVVGAASKGIIQRDHQHNAGVYRSYYAANPFENMTEEEIDAYKQGLQPQEHGEEADDVAAPEGRLISSEERQQNLQQQSQEEALEDTEARAGPQVTTAESVVSEGPEARQAHRTPPSPVSPKEAMAQSMPPASPPLSSPSLEDLGLTGLLDTLLKAAVNAALSFALPDPQPSPSQSGPPHEHSTPLSTAQSSHLSSPAPVHSTVGTGAESPGELVKAGDQQIEVPVSESDMTEAPQIMTVRLQPNKLFQGKTGDGVMKISFSIQSNVTRRKGKGPKSSWPVENVTIIQTQPKVVMVQPAQSHPPKVLQEQQNVAQVPCLEQAPSPSVPLSPACREKQYKRNTQSPGKRQGSSRLSKPRKKFSRWSRRGLTHPLSPVKEELWDGDDTLEALLAKQNVQLDSDESLEDLLLMTDDYKENFVSKAQADKCQASSSVDRAAPIATVEDLDENGSPPPAPVQREKPLEEPVLVANQATVSHSSPSDHRQSNDSPVKPYPSPEQQPLTGDKTSIVTEVLEPQKKALDIDNDIKFADEELSSTFPEASDGDIAPRKQEESVETPGQLHPASESRDRLSEEASKETSRVLPVSAAKSTDDFVEKEDARQANNDQNDSVSRGADQTAQAGDGTGKTEMETAKTGKTEVASAKTGKTEVASAKTGKTEVASAKTGKTEVASAKTGKTEVASAKTGKTEVASAKTGKTEVASAKTGKTEVASAKTGKTEVASAKTGKTEVASAKTDETTEVATAKTDETTEVATAKTDETTEVSAAKTEKTEVVTARTDTKPAGLTSEPEVASAPKLSSEPVVCAPLAAQEEDISDVSRTTIGSGEEEKAKTSLYRTESACLENSPIVSSPPYDAFPPEPIYRELHRVRSLENELDDSSSVQRRLNKGHDTVRRVQSSYDSLPNKNRNVAVIDAVLHTVTIDPAKIAQSGQSVSKYLAGPSDESSPSDQKKKWTLMDSVSKSLETLDVNDLAMIYGRSLEVIIQDGDASSMKSSQTSLISQTKAKSQENVLEDSSGKEKGGQKGTKLYQDDVVVIAKTPLDFSAISPQVRKDITEEEGPLVTSSPKLGRKKESSFKKYQSKMGKSEETLLEVVPLSPERTRPTAERSKSFPKNYRLIKNRSRETILDDTAPLQKSEKEREMRSSSQSVDELSERNRHGSRTKHRRARNSDPLFSHSARDSVLQSDWRKTNSLGRRNSEEVFARDMPSPARSAHSMDRLEANRQEDDSRRRRRRQQSPDIGREQGRRRRRRGGADHMPATEAGVEEEPARTQSLGRDRRRRRGEADHMPATEAEEEEYTAQTQSLGRDRRRRRGEADHMPATEARVEEYTAQTQSLGRDRRRRRGEADHMPATEAGEEEYTAQTQSLGRDRRRRRGEADHMPATEAGEEEYTAQTQSLGRDRRRRRGEADHMPATEAGEEEYTAQTQSLGRDRRRRRGEADHMPATEAGEEEYTAQTQSLGRDRRRRRGEADHMPATEAGEEEYTAQTQSLGRDRRRRRGEADHMPATEAGEEEYTAQTQSLGRDRRRRRGEADHMPATEAGVEEEPAQTQSLGRDRSRRRGGAEDHMAATETGVEEYTAQTQSLGRDRRRRRRHRDLEETGTPPPPSEAAGRGQERRNSDTHLTEDTGHTAVVRKEAQAAEQTPVTSTPEPELQDIEDLPPPPDDLLYDYDKQTETVAEDADNVTSQQEDDKQLPAYPTEVQKIEDEDEENQPPHVQSPKQPKSKQSERASTDSRTPKVDGDTAEENEVRRRSKKSDTNPSAEETTFMATFKQPVRNSQTLGEDFPSLSTRAQSVESTTLDKEEADIDSGKGTKDGEKDSLSRPLEHEGTVPIAGNLDILDYNDETNKENDPSHYSPTEDEKSKTSRARQRAERRRRGRLGSDKETFFSIEGQRGSRDSLLSGETKVSSSRSSLTRQDSLDSKELREHLGKRSSREIDNSKSPKENRVSRESLLSKEFKSTRSSRDSLARRDSQESVGLDIMSLDQEPPRGRRDRSERDSGSKRSQGESEVASNEKPRSEGHIRGRRSGRGEGQPHNDRPRRSSRIDEEEAPNVPLINMQTASRETLDREDFAPPLPPKQHRSRERLSQLDYEPRQSSSREMLGEPRQSRSREMLDAPGSPDAPPELPPKKNRKSLSCVSGQDTESGAPAMKERRPKERSSTKDRKKMPPPPAPPGSEQHYSEEPRRRRRHDSKHLSVPGDSFYRESSFDTSFDKDRKGSRPYKSRELASSYYGDSEDDLESTGARIARREKKKMAQEDVAVSPPQTPRPARKISTSSYGSVSARIARSVSFDDGYTPTMSHPPRHSKSRESLGTEASYHSTSYRPRSYSGASETSVTSNPLNHEPWRAKAVAQRPSSRSHRSQAQGEPTYSANAGRRRRSRPPSASDTNRLYQPRRTRSRTSLPDSPTRSTTPSGHSKSREASLMADDSFSDAYSHGYASEAMPPVPAPRSDPDRRSKRNRHREGDGEKPGTYGMDSASGGETLEERSSKEGSPTKEAPSPTKEKKKKKKFTMPSFSKKKKDSKESTM